MEIKTVVEEMKARNGNKRFQTNDLAWYIVNRVEGIDNKLDRKLDVTTFWKVLGGTLILFGIFVGVMV